MSNSGISENMSKYLIVMCCFGMVLGKPKQNTKPERRCSNLGLKQRVEILEATLQGLPDIDDLRSRVENLEAALQVLTDFEDLPRRVEVLENYLSCAPPVAVEHASIISDPGKTSYYPGDQLTYQCDFPYVRQSGDETRQCSCHDVPIGSPFFCTWTGEPPVCAIGCAGPGAVEHGHIQNGPAEKIFYSLNEYLIYKCEFDYFRESGNDFRQCVCDETAEPPVCEWSGDPPVCAKDKCYLPKVVGNSDCGNVAVYREYWDHEGHLCTSFTYLGCDGNENNFDPSSSSGFECHGCNPCSHPKLVGNCTDPPVPTEQRWYYSTSTWDCEEFTYSGCINDPDQGVNKNNFRSREECCMHCWSSQDNHKARTSLNSGPIHPLTSEVPALEHSKKYCGHDKVFSFDRIFCKLAYNEDRHKILDKFHFRPEQTIRFRITCPFSHRFIVEKTWTRHNDFVFDGIVIKLTG